MWWQSIEGPDLNETSEDDSGDDIIEDEMVQPPNNDNLVPPDSMCLSCDQACAEKYAFFPCGHQPFCNICKEFPTCTVCNQDVVLRLKLISREI